MHQDRQCVRGGKNITKCPLFENSKKALAVQWQADINHTTKILAAKKQLVGLGRDREGGGGGGETTKQKFDRKQAERAAAGGKNCHCH